MQTKVSAVLSTAELATVVGRQWEAVQSLPIKKPKTTKNKQKPTQTTKPKKTTPGAFCLPSRGQTQLSNFTSEVRKPPHVFLSIQLTGNLETHQIKP